MKLTPRQCYDALKQVNWLQSGQANVSINGISTDSRTVSYGQLFVALRGDHFDGNLKVADAVDKGAVAVVMEDILLARQIAAQNSSVAIFVVTKAREALLQLALFWRKQFHLPVIAVTGSNGKTTVKEMIAAIFRQAVGGEAVLATQGNLNNEVGVPLTLFGLSAPIQLAVIELGMNHPGEIAPLAEAALPTVALVNNAQREHQEFMNSVEAVAIENGMALKALGGRGVAVFPADDEHTPVWFDLAGSSQFMTFGWTPSGNEPTFAVPTIHAQSSSSASEFALHHGQDTHMIKLNIAGRHNVRNALAAAACAHAAGVSWPHIIAGLAAFEPVSGRLVVAQVQRYGATHTVVDDTYNANPDSVLAAIDVLSDLPHPQLLVLGDMGEVGHQGPQFHAEIGQQAAKQNIDQLFTLGELARFSSEAYAEAGGQARHFVQLDGEQGLLAAVDATLASATVSQAVLVKGSRFMRMERVVNHLVTAHVVGAAQ